MDKICWFWLSGNPIAIALLENNMDKVNRVKLSRNPNAIHLLCKLDYLSMKENMSRMSEELASVVFHPKRLLKICDDYNIEFDEVMDIY